MVMSTTERSGNGLEGRGDVSCSTSASTSFWCCPRPAKGLPQGAGAEYCCCGLAPMVRIGHLGFRELCAKHGADVVFSEEVVAAKLARCRREVTIYPWNDRDAAGSPTTEVVEYVCYEAWKNKWKRTVVFSAVAHPIEASTVLQLGVADPEIASKAVREVWQDVNGIDVNMGCPKSFSVKNGFGAALMRKPQVAGSILRAIHDALNSPSALQQRRQVIFQKNISSNSPSSAPVTSSSEVEVQPVPLSLKCRLLATPEETFHMLETVLEAAGHTSALRVVHSIGIHARYVDQRSETAARYEEAGRVVTLCRASERFSGIVFVLNGSIASRADATAKCKAYGFDAAMLARAALEDPTVFQHPPYPTQAEHRKELPQNVEAACLSSLTESSKVSPFSAAEKTGITNVAGSKEPTGPADDAAVRMHYMKVLQEMWEYAVLYRTPFTSFKYHVQRLVPEVSVLKSLMPRLQEECREYVDYLRVIEFAGGDSERQRLHQLAQRCHYELVVLDHLEWSDPAPDTDQAVRGQANERKGRKRGWEEDVSVSGEISI